MLPLLTFASGFVAGVVGLRLIKSVNAPETLRSAAGKARQGLDQAQSSLRQATVSGLSTIEKSSASLRSKLAETAAPGPAAEAAPAPAVRKARVVKPKAAKAPAAKPARARKAAPKPPAAGGNES